jgi:hypothetical protein
MRAFLCPLVLSLAGLAATPASARLPPPTAEEQAVLEAKAAREQEQLEREKEALLRAQDAVAARYRKERASRVAPALEDTNLPKNAIELPRDAGPDGRREPSAEAHGAPAR